MRKLIVGCGYLGQRVAAVWQRAGHDVFALTRSPQRAERFQAQGVHPILGDVLQPASLRELPPCETLLYAVGYDRGSGRSQRDVYVDGLRNVLGAVAGRAGHLLYVSSTSVYGQTGGEWVDESSVCEPQSSNGQVCLEAEQLIWQSFPADKSTIAGADVLRLAGIYGPGRLLRRIAALQSGEPISGNPEAWLNLIHVDDAVRAVLACDAQRPAHSTWLVCDNRPIRRREYYTQLAALVGAPAPQFAGDAAETNLNKRCSNHRLRDELRVDLQYPSIETGLPHALAAASDSSPPGSPRWRND